MARISKIEKRIERKFNTAKYETLVVSVSFQEEVEWDGLKQRRQKSDNITQQLLADFNKTKATVFKELGLEEKNAHMEKPLKSDQAESISEIGLDQLG
jgi:hypothetical protein